MKVTKEFEQKNVGYSWEIEWRGVEYSGTLLISGEERNEHWEWDVDEDGNSDDLSDEEYYELLSVVKSEYRNDMLIE